ncbi:DNA sulfur modification protein DndD [Paenisporosarcina quisquiliarum]|uniref:Nuclease SbcCD subunit C n=1 Tax=Paenisporosarcina quisquiliarum TaxID=365346 RepID=A0A9X3LHW3_9BACL|nr:DNA sulfur modification protein DndD [Paenisporosarcina quisquiliarum]MCZ8538298.1 DNA sulfur modification protein DndD [Paenisporosarcina quisquiliarum]
MIINEIQLTNIGPYKGFNRFDLRTVNGKNVILIGGENGAGKTTLLNAIKLGLFGAYSFGHKNESNEYFKRIKSMLNHQAKKEESDDFKIKLDFTLINNFEKIDYSLYRTWHIKKMTLKETYDILANGKHLSDSEKDLFQSQLKEVMPPQLLDFCLFDGEEIARIVNKDLLSEYLSKLSRVVFNLDLFEVLETDLMTYSNQTLDFNKMTSFEKELFRLNEEEKHLKEEINKVTALLEDLNKQKQEFSEEYISFKQDFDTHGGLIKAQRDQILKEINILEQERKQNTEKIKEFVSTLLPFLISKQLLTRTRSQIVNEESNHLFRQLDQKLSPEKLEGLISLFSDKLSDENIAAKLKISLLDLVKPETVIRQIHGASFSESSLVENMYHSVCSNEAIGITSMISENRKKLENLQVLRGKLKVNDSTNEFNSMLSNMEKLQIQLVNIDQKIVNLGSKITDLRNKHNNLSTSIEKHQLVIKDTEKTKSSYLESQKIIELSKRFRELQLKKKLQEVQIEASVLLKKMFRKQNYINSIRIDPKTYNVVLLDSQSEEIEKTTLSAGEKEILIISLIGSIFKCSGRKVPFIFDSLLGRLDKTHKSTLLTEFIPNCGRQAIILSTDTEIDEVHYKMLKNHISKEYILDFDVINKETHIKNYYFPVIKNEVKI